jgi:putative transposase
MAESFRGAAHRLDPPRVSESNQVLVLGERHLRRTLTRYFTYYHRTRTHLALEKDAPDRRPVQRPEAGAIVATPEVGGLHHRSARQAA